MTERDSSLGIGPNAIIIWPAMPDCLGHLSGQKFQLELLPHSFSIDKSNQTAHLIPKSVFNLIGQNAEMISRRVKVQYLLPEERMRKDYPLRAVRGMVDERLKHRLCGVCGEDAKVGLPSGRSRKFCGYGSTLVGAQQPIVRSCGTGLSTVTTT